MRGQVRRRAHALPAVRGVAVEHLGSRHVTLLFVVVLPHETHDARHVAKLVLIAEWDAAVIRYNIISCRPPVLCSQPRAAHPPHDAARWVQDCEDGPLLPRARHHFLNDSFYPSILLDAAHCNGTAG